MDQQTQIFQQEKFFISQNHHHHHNMHHHTSSPIGMDIKPTISHQPVMAATITTSVTTVIKSYKRRSNPELEKRRIHACEYKGKICKLIRHYSGQRFNELTREATNSID